MSASGAHGAGPEWQEAATDQGWMGQALALAARARGLTSPNPMVGALVVQGDRIVGQGFHAWAGGPHAEAVALEQAGSEARGGTLYVTLEPCTHWGRTPPCAPAVVAAGIRRVVIGVADANPEVPGGGAQALRDAGLEVVVGCRETEARELNRVFFTAMTHRRPHVTLKCAMTLDGKIAAADRSSRWITGQAARDEGHRLRSAADAIVVGIGTVLLDDPALTVRLPDPWPREPFRVVLDSRGRLPLSARVIAAGSPARVIIATTAAAPGEWVRSLERLGVTVLRCAQLGGRVDLSDLCAQLFELKVTGVLLEAGTELNAAFLEAELVDRVTVFIAPKILGGSAAPTAVGGVGRPLAGALRLERVDVRRVGDDWLFEGDVSRGRGPGPGPGEG